MYNDSLQGVGPGDLTMVVAVLYGTVHNCHLGPHSILYNGYLVFLGVKAAGIYNFLINCRTENFPFNIPSIHIANNSPRVTPTSFSLFSSQQLCIFCSPGQYNLKKQEQSPCLNKMQALTAIHNKFVPNGLYHSNFFYNV